jgi:hypothetical protein
VAPDVPPLISQEEALELGRITDRAGIEAPRPDGAPNTFPEIVRMEGE